MDYSDVRSRIKSGDLLAWSHRRSMFASWYDFKVGLVRLFRRSEYTHVGLAWVVSGRVFVLEAVVPAIRIYPLSKCSDFYWIPLNSNWSPEVEEEAILKVGLPYSQLSAIKASFFKLAKEDVSECAAYVIHILREAGIELGETATPDAVVLLAQQIPGTLTAYVSNKELA